MKYIASLLFFLFTGCATILTGNKDYIKFESMPDSSDVSINGIYKGKTPLYIPIERSMSHVPVSITKPGYKESNFELRRNINIITCFNFFFPWGIIVDIISGSIFIYSPSYYYLKLEKE